MGRVGIGRDRVAAIGVWGEAVTEEGRKLTMGMFGTVWEGKRPDSRNYLAHKPDRAVL